MENKRDFVLLFTHSIALIFGVGLGYYAREHISCLTGKSVNDSNINDNTNQQYCVDVFDSSGNHKLINYFIDETNNTIIFEEDQTNISFVISKNGREIFNLESFTGKEYKFI
jgi:hypothetical protein